jgi:hypothetical protein
MLPRNGQVVTFEGKTYHVLKSARVSIDVVRTDFTYMGRIRWIDGTPVREATSEETQSLSTRLNGPPTGSRIEWDGKEWTVLRKEGDCLVIERLNSSHLAKLHVFAPYQVVEIADASGSEVVAARTTVPGDGSLIRLAGGQELCRVSYLTDKSYALIGLKGRTVVYTRDTPCPQHDVEQELQQPVVELDEAWIEREDHFHGKTPESDVARLLEREPTLWPPARHLRFYYVDVPRDAKSVSTHPVIRQTGPLIGVWVPKVPTYWCRSFPNQVELCLQAAGLVGLVCWRSAGACNQTLLSFYVFLRLQELRMQGDLGMAGLMLTALTRPTALAEETGDMWAKIFRETALVSGESPATLNSRIAVGEHREEGVRGLAEKARTASFAAAPVLAPLNYHFDDEVQRVAFGVAAGKSHSAGYLSAYDVKKLLEDNSAPQELLLDACRYSDLVEVALRHRNLPAQGLQVAAEEGFVQVWAHPKVNDTERHLLLHALGNGKNVTWAAQSFALSADLPVGMRLPLAESAPRELARCLAERKDVTGDEGRLLLARFRGDMRIAGGLARYCLDAELLTDLAGSEWSGQDSSVAEALAGNDHAPPAVLQAVAERCQGQDGEKEIQEALARNAATPASVLARLARSRFPSVKLLVASHANIPREILKALSKLKGEPGEVARERLA